MTKIKLPTVVIVGRTNVGKSTLFNRLSVAVKAITLDYAGVTRDFLRDTVCWKGKSFELIDTGGISLRKTMDQIENRSREIALTMLKEASLVLFIVDGKVGLVDQDREIARIVHKLGKPCVLVINKMDAKITQDHLYEFNALGYQSIIPVSAQHGTGIADLLQAIISEIPEPKELSENEPVFRVAFLGKPNVGKSSLMNSLIKKERAIVSPEPGTTREAIIEKIQFYQEDIVLVDTPGVRRKRKVTETLEDMMVQSSMRALKDSDVVLLLIDSSFGVLSDQELKLAFYAFEQQYKAVMILFNKSDLVDETIKQNLDRSIDEYKYLIDKLITLPISCVSQKNVGRILPAVKELWQRSSQSFDSDDLTQLFLQALILKPLFHQQKKLLFYSARQIKTSPITIVIHVNEPTWYGQSQLGFLEKLLRQKFDLRGVPVKFIVRKGR